MIRPESTGRLIVFPGAPTLADVATFPPLKGDVDPGEHEAHHRDHDKSQAECDMDRLARGETATHVPLVGDYACPYCDPDKYAAIGKHRSDRSAS